jgi:glycosyltransferase involved in cell wall biosynthesis
MNGATNVVLGERMAASLMARGIRGIELIPNWADGAAIQPLSDCMNKLRASWGLDERFVTCYSGNAGRVHELDTIIAAAERLRDEETIVFLFIGGGSETERLRKEVTQRKLRNVSFRSYQSRELLGQSLALADVHLVSLRPEFEGLVVPSKYYGIIAAGRPCVFIGDPHGEIAQLVHDGGCGITVVPGDGEALAKVILELQQNADRRKVLGSAARRQFDLRFTKPIAMARWEKVLHTVAINR